MKRELYLLIMMIVVVGIFGGTAVVLGPASAGEEGVKFNPEALLAAAGEAYYRGEFNQALEVYHSILKEQPEEHAALANSWFISKEQGELEEALIHNQRIIDNNPQSYYWRYQLGSTFYQLGNYEQAVRVLAELYLKIKDPGGGDSGLTTREEGLFYYYLGSAYAGVNEQEKAEFFFRKGIEEMPQLALNQIALGELYESKGDYQQAAAAYREALKRDYSLSFLHPRLARLAELTGEVEEAFYYWRNSLITGEQADLARDKLQALRQEYPELEEQYREDREREYRETKLLEVAPVSYQGEIPRIRVGLIEKTGAVSFRTGAPFQLLSFTGEVVFNGSPAEEWTLTRSGDTYFLKRGIEREITIPSGSDNPAAANQQGQGAVRIKNDGPLILRLTDERHTFLLYNISYGQGYFWAGQEDRQYRGGLELLPAGEDQFRLINLVNLEEYLFSVIPAEMPAWWPEEALKAQAIAARTYALGAVGRHSESGYDLCDDVHCAVYKGAGNEHRKSNQAVLDTLGEAALYQGQIISAVFTSNSGGYSESSSEVWGYEHAYLQGANNLLADSYQFPLEPYRLTEWLLKEPASYSSQALYAGYNKYRWVKVVNGEYFEDRFDLEGLENIIPLGRSTGGSVERVVLKGRDKKGRLQEVTISKDLIRGRLGGLKSNRFVIDQIRDSRGYIERLIFYGSGFGHSVGMDQTGAAGMADSGKSYREIVKHFYQGVELKKMY